MLEITKILAVLEIAKIPIKNIYGPKVTISGFGNLSNFVKGYVRLDLKVGLLHVLIAFDDMDVDTSYHILLGRP